MRLLERARRGVTGRADGGVLAALVATLDGMETVAVRAAKDQLSALLDRVAGTHERVTITRHGRAAAVLISADDLAALEETLDVLSDPELRTRLTEGRAAVAAGDVVDEEGLRKLVAARTA